MSLPWCEKCKGKCNKPGYINTRCLACKWQYVGQKAFDRKEDLFIEDQNVTNCKTPYEYFGNSIEYVGVDII